ncbi:MAG: DUF1343 domain-containing protein [Candidatus Riflebacteria bacterium]|nr:DUF1343 domain-containing protein [Candidatus Riflebacteria bacterium]
MTVNFDFGLENFLSDNSITGKIAIVTNNTGRDRQGIHIVERISQKAGINILKIFTPEHGFGSNAPDGEAVSNSSHSSFKIPITSLYGPKKKPDYDDLKGLDFVLFDIQDVGVRFYTYISTLRNIIDSCAQFHIPVIILDRPNLICAEKVEGPIMETGFESFVGYLPVPLRYGLTPAELGLWWNSQLSIPAEIKVYKCQGYSRSSIFENLGIPWFQPSPSMISIETAKFYPGTCFFEGINVSEGRGTDKPFQKLGAPWINSRKWHHHLSSLLPKDVTIFETEFTPTFSKYQGELCRGIFLQTTLPVLPDTVKIAIKALFALIQSHPGKIEFSSRPGFHHPFFDLLAGNSWLRNGLKTSQNLQELESRVSQGIEEFKKNTEKFHLYQ